MLIPLEYLTSHETNVLLNGIDNTRDHAILSLFLNTGLFLNEAVNLQIDAVNWEKRRLKIAGQRPRQIPLNDQAFEALARWSKEQIDSPVSTFFTTTRGEMKSLSARSFDKQIRKYAKRAGIKRRVNALVLRNTFAVRLFSQEISLAKAAAILGVSDADSIKRYILASKETPGIKIAAETLAKVDTRPFWNKWADKYFPTTPRIAKSTSSPKGTKLINPAELVFGREGIIDEIRKLLLKKQPVLLIGPLGTGKTHLLKHLSHLLGPDTLYLASPSPLKNLLAQVCTKIDPEWKKELKAHVTTREMLDYIIKARPSLVLMVDNLDALKNPDSDLFLSLFEHCTILGSTEALNPKLKQVWWKFMQIKLPPLSEESSKALIKYLSQNLAVSDYAMLETRILTISNRLPLAIVDMVNQVSRRAIVNRDAIREVYHEAGIHYRDWTPAVVILWGMAIISRFVALGTHNFEGYILAGFGTSLLVTIRYFIFKMR